jgi:hypothetical protein
MLQRLLRVSVVLRDLTAVQPMDSPFAELVVPVSISDTVDAKSFWVSVRALEQLFKALSLCLTYMEGDSPPFSCVYACFLAMAFTVRQLAPEELEAVGLQECHRELILEAVLKRFATIYSPAYALAFLTDPLFVGMRKAVAIKMGEAFTYLGQASIVDQARAALARIARGDHTLRRAMAAELSTFVNRESSADDVFEDVYSLPQDMWGLSDERQYGHLRLPLMRLHASPVGATSCERNHKTANRVHSSTRNRLAAPQVEMGTAIAFNARQLENKKSTTWDCKFLKWLSQVGIASGQPTVDELTVEEEQTSEQNVAEFMASAGTGDLTDSTLFQTVVSSLHNTHSNCIQ